MTVEDVVYSLSRLRGAERLKAASYLATVSEVTASGTGTVVIRTRWPNALLLNNLSFVPIVPRGSTTGTLESHPNGTGPWRVDAWKPGKSLRLQWNPEYWGPKPDFERASVDLAVSEEDARSGIGASRWDALRLSSQAVQKLARQGDAYAGRDLPEHLPSAPRLRRLPRRDARSAPVSRTPSRSARSARRSAWRWTGRPSRGGPTPTPSPRHQLVPLAVFGFDPNAPPLGQDVERARRLLADAGFPNGFDVVLHRSGYGAAAEEVKEQLARVGIRVTVSQLRSADFFAALNRKELELLDRGRRLHDR